MKTTKWHSAMSKFNLKSAGFITLTLFCSHSWAQPPWAEDDAQPEAVSATPDESVTSPAMTDTDTLDNTTPANEPVTGSPMMNEASLPAANVETTQKGDVLTMPAQKAKATAVRLLDFPRRGMSQDKVENEMGRPSEIIPAVGHPPITRWVYDDRIVYFEYAAVIHVVAK